MSERPENLPALTEERLSEIKDLLAYESSISFHSARAHESMWMLVADHERGLKYAELAGRQAARLDAVHALLLDPDVDMIDPAELREALS